MTVETTDYKYQIPVTTQLYTFRDYRNSPMVSLIFTWISPLTGKTHQDRIALASGVSYQDLMEKTIALFKEPASLHATVNAGIQKSIANVLRVEVPVDIYEPATEYEFNKVLAMSNFNFTAPIDLKQSVQPQVVKNEVQ